MHEHTSVVHHHPTTPLYDTPYLMDIFSMSQVDYLAELDRERGQS